MRMIASLITQDVCLVHKEQRQPDPAAHARG
jgi:hypothetical protein